MTRLMILSFALATSLAANAAQAATAAIKYHDLDLSTESGKAQLDLRIDRAARKICRDQQRTGTRIPSSESRETMMQCKAEVRAEVLAKLPRQA